MGEQEQQKPEEQDEQKVEMQDLEAEPQEVRGGLIVTKVTAIPDVVPAD